MKFNIYDGDNEERFVLGRGGDRKLFVTGLNPSTANAEKSDQPTTKVDGFAKRRNCDGFVMLNLCALRSTSPATLPGTEDEERLANSITRNKKAIQTILNQEKGITVWAAWETTSQNIATCLTAWKRLRGLPPIAMSFGSSVVNSRRKVIRDIRHAKVTKSHSSPSTLRGM